MVAFWDRSYDKNGRKKDKSAPIWLKFGTNFLQIVLDSGIISYTLPAERYWDLLRKIPEGPRAEIFAFENLGNLAEC